MIYDEHFKELNNSKEVAIDCEFMGYLGSKEFNHLCCTIQLATMDKIFIYPLGHFSEYQKRRFYKKFEQLLLSEKTRK